MHNSDILRRFEDWLLAPKETLDFEVKTWIDMTAADGQGQVAKALIALQNHGGGFLLFGYKEVGRALVEDLERPCSLTPYLTDAINSIVRARAEPAFHVEVTIQKHPHSGLDYPLVSVPGGSLVPVRSCSSTAKSLADKVYYIRAPGPESRAPMDAHEWDTLLRRVVLNQREEIVSLLKKFASWNAEAEPASSSDDGAEKALRAFARSAEVHWKSRNDSLPPTSPSKVTQGYYLLAAKVIGANKRLSPKQVLEANTNARRYTGWPPFIVTYGVQGMQPQSINGLIEAWLGASGDSDVGHADFWRISPAGEFVLIRGYQEDAGGSNVKAGCAIEVSLPIWRVGEFLLRAAELADVMFEPNAELCVYGRWTGLRDRRLFSNEFFRRAPDGVAATNEVDAYDRFPVSETRDLLPTLAIRLTRSLYEAFNFFELPSAIAEEWIERMRGRHF